MHVAVFTTQPIAVHTQAVLDTLLQAGHSYAIVSDVQQFHQGFDVGWIRIVPGDFAFEPPLYWHAFCFAQHTGLPMLNELMAGEMASDKMLNARCFALNNIPHPETQFLHNAKNWNHWPAICKPIMGARSDGVVVVETMKQALAHQAIYGQTMVLQQFIEAARCIRVIATDETAVRAYEKKLDGQRIVSVAVGAERIPVEKDGALGQLAVAMVKAVGGHLMGVDILVDSQGNLFALEVNAAFAFDAADQIIAQAFVNTLQNQSQLTNV